MLPKGFEPIHHKYRSLNPVRLPVSPQELFFFCYHYNTKIKYVIQPVVEFFQKSRSIISAKGILISSKTISFLKTSILFTFPFAT